MQIKKVIARSVKDSRGEKTIQVIVKTSKGKFVTSAPAGKSRGKYEVRSYLGSLKGDIGVINNLKVEKLNGLRLQRFEDLKKVEKLVGMRVGGNTLFAFEACLLKGLARENKLELWEFLGGTGKKKMRSVGNTVGGGLHARGVKGHRPDFQEFLFIANGKSFSENVKINKKAYKMVGKLLKARSRDDEGAWETGLGNEMVLGVMNQIRSQIGENKIDIGLDIAGSSFYKNGKYNYKNPRRKMSRNDQIVYVRELIESFNIFYIEDGLNENDFSGFREIKSKGSLNVGDDLIATNPSRLRKAIRLRAINTIIVKPNQIGSLLKFKKVINICKKHKIKTVISHRAGETNDNTIADLGVGFGCDFIKTGIYGSVRESKLKRLVKILG